MSPPRVRQDEQNSSAQHEKDARKDIPLQPFQSVMTEARRRTTVHRARNGISTPSLVLLHMGRPYILQTQNGPLGFKQVDEPTKGPLSTLHHACFLHRREPLSIQICSKCRTANYRAANVR